MTLAAYSKQRKRSKRIFQVGHNRRFAPVYAELKQMLSSTHQPHSAHVKMNRGELLNPEWVGDPKITGGFLYETTIHMFDMLRFLFGEVKKRCRRLVLRMNIRKPTTFPCCLLLPAACTRPWHLRPMRVGCFPSNASKFFVITRRLLRARWRA